MRSAVLAVLCLRAIADEGSLLQVHSAMNSEDTSIEDASRMQKIAEKTGMEIGTIKSIFQNATRMVRQNGGPPRSFDEVSNLGIKQDLTNHPVAQFLAMKSNSDKIKQALHPAARSILDSLKATNSSSAEDALKAYATSNEKTIQRFLFSADEAMKSADPTSNNCALYLPNHKYTLKFYLKGYNGCPNRMNFRYRVQLKLNLGICQYEFKGEDMSFSYKFREDNTEIQWGDPIYWKGLANGFFVIKYVWTKSPEEDHTCNGDIVRWGLAVSWKVNQANQQEGPKMGPCNAKTLNDGGVSIAFKWEDNVARGGYPMRFEDAQTTWSFSHGTTYFARWDGKKGYEGDFTIFANQFIWGFAYGEVKAKPPAYDLPADLPACRK